MNVDINQERIEAAIIDEAVDRIVGDNILGRIEKQIKNRLDEAMGKSLNSKVEEMVNSVMTSALESEIHPINTFGEREGPPTTIKAALHDRAKDFWSEKVNTKGEKSSYGGRPRYEHVIGTIAAQEFESQVKQNIANIAAAIKESVREGMYAEVDKNVNQLFNVKTQKKANG